MLCAVCMSIFLQSEDRGAYHQDRESVTTAAKNGCRICHYIDKKLQGRDSFPSQYELKWEAGRFKVRFYYPLPQLPIAGWNQLRRVYAYVQTVEEAPAGHDSFIASVTADLKPDPCRVRTDFPSLRNIPNSTGHEDVARLAKSWLQDCKQNHNLQVLLETRDSKSFPQRLIYVGHADLPPRLVLREEDHVQGGYAALSHCWGQGKQRKLRLLRIGSMAVKQKKPLMPLFEMPSFIV